MFQGLWYTWKLNDNVIPFQGVYIIECDGKVFHAGQTDNFERRRAEHVRDHTVNSLWHPDPNYLCMAVGDRRFLDGIEAFLGRVFRVPIDKRYADAPEIPCNLPPDLSASASAPPRSNSLWDWTPEPSAMQSYRSEHLNPYDVLREITSRFGSTQNEVQPYLPEPNNARSFPETSDLRPESMVGSIAEWSLVHVTTGQSLGVRAPRRSACPTCAPRGGPRVRCMGGFKTSQPCPG